MSSVHRSECRSRRSPSLCLLLVVAATSEAQVSESSGAISSADIEQSVASSLPKLQGRSAAVGATLDLTRSFETRTQWTFVATILPGSHFTGADNGLVDGGALAQCFVNNLTPNCKYAIPKRDSDWFSIPIELYSAEVVFRGANSTRPLLMIKTGSAHGGNGSHLVFTELFTYDRRLNKFQSVFSTATGSNNNQKTSFIKEGPLRGDVVLNKPAGCCYRIEVYRQAASGQYVSILGYRSRTVYGDRNPLSVSDSEMPEILRRLGLWRASDPLPIPHEGCTPVMRAGEEWCQ
jgi:hypothetical protein